MWERNDDPDVCWREEWNGGRPDETWPEDAGWMDIGDGWTWDMGWMDRVATREGETRPKLDHEEHEDIRATREGQSKSRLDQQDDEANREEEKAPKPQDKEDIDIGKTREMEADYREARGGRPSNQEGEGNGDNSNQATKNTKGWIKPAITNKGEKSRNNTQSSTTRPGHGHPPGLGSRTRPRLQDQTSSRTATTPAHTQRPRDWP